MILIGPNTALMQMHKANDFLFILNSLGVFAINAIRKLIRDKYADASVSFV